jgi:CheY-like chemotaxis protein
MGKRVLIVDDDTSIAEILEFNLKNEGYEVETAVSAEDALKKSLDNFHIVLLDVMMGGMSVSSNMFVSIGVMICMYPLFSLFTNFDIFK